MVQPLSAPLCRLSRPERAAYGSSASCFSVSLAREGQLDECLAAVVKLVTEAIWRTPGYESSLAGC